MSAVGGSIVEGSGADLFTAIAIPFVLDIAFNSLAYLDDSDQCSSGGVAPVVQRLNGSTDFWSNLAMASGWRMPTRSLVLEPSRFSGL